MARACKRPNRAEPSDTSTSTVMSAEPVKGTMGLPPVASPLQGQEAARCEGQGTAGMRRQFREG